MRILLTNDDGIDAPGLAALARRLHEDGHDLLVAAPTGDVSGSGTSLGTVADGAVIPAREAGIPSLPDVAAYAVDAPPAFIALAACTGALGEPPGFVISGVNPGHNTGRTLLYSSTVGAAIAAASCGRPAMAVSCGTAPAGRLDTAVEVSAVAFALFLEHLPRSAVLNVNVPDLDVAEILSVRRARLGRLGSFSITFEPVRGGLRMWYRPTTERKLREQPHRDGDSALVAAGYVTLTALAGGIEDPALTRAVDELAAEVADRLAAHVPARARR
jgi:5'-nucleotidase